MIAKDKIERSKLSSMAIGSGKTEVVYWDSVEDLTTLYQSKWFEEHHWVALGGGYNTVWTGTKNHPIPLISRDHSRAFVDDFSVVAGSAVEWPSLVTWIAKKGWWGTELLAEIPGTCGASVVQNIGAYGAELSDILISIEVFDTVLGTCEIKLASQLELGYRDSILKKKEYFHWIVTKINLQLAPVSKKEITYPALIEWANKHNLQTKTPLQVATVVTSLRQSKLSSPEEIPNCGSFFVNPVVSKTKLSELGAKYPTIPFFEYKDDVKIPAAWLIEQSGLKGQWLNNTIQVSPTQALVLTNPHKNATPQDLLDGEKIIIDAVKEKFGIQLQSEVRHY